jgi:autotransporter-associated beta strand protein
MKFETRSPDRAPEHISTLKTLGRIRRLRTSLVAAIFGLAVSGPLALAQSTWTGTGGNANWNTAGNWSGGTPTSSATTDLIFAGTTNTGTLGTPLNQNLGNLTLRSLTFDLTAGNFFLGGNQLQVQNTTTFTITQSSANSQNIANAITHTGGNNPVTLALGGSGAGTVTLSGLISDGSGFRDLNILKSGTSTFVLTNASNSFNGTTTIRGGSLIVGANAPYNANGALGSAISEVVLGDGSTTAGDAPALLINGAFTVDRNITVGSVTNTAAYNATIGGSNTAGTSTFSRNITLNTTAANYTTTLQAATGGTVDFVTGTWTTNNKAIVIGSSGNTGTVKLSNTLSTTGGISVNFGTFLLGSSNRLGDTTPVTVAGGIFDTAGFTDTVSTFNMSSGSLNGSGTITAATYGLSGGTVNADLGAGTMNVTTGTVNLNGTSAATVVNVNSGTLSLGAANRLANTAAVAVGGGNLNIAGNSDTVGTVTLTNGSISGTSGVLTGTSYAVQNGTISAILGGTGGLTKTTGGTVTLSGANTYSGTTTLTTGTLLIENTTDSGTGTGAVTTASGTFLRGSGRIAPATGNNVAINGTLTIGQDGAGVAQDFEVALTNAALNMSGSTITQIDLFGDYNSGSLNGASLADRLAITYTGASSVSLNGILDFNLLSSPAISPGLWTKNSSWQLFSWNGLTPTGTFSSITGLPDLSPLGLGWDTSNLYTTGQLSIIPEPRMTSLIWLGLLATQLRRRRPSPRVLI